MWNDDPLHGEIIRLESYLEQLEAIIAAGQERAIKAGESLLASQMQRDLEFRAMFDLLIGEIFIVRAHVMNWNNPSFGRIPPQSAPALQTTSSRRKEDLEMLESLDRIRAALLQMRNLVECPPPGQTPDGQSAEPPGES